MKILSIDQARHGGWAIYDYEKKKLLKYGTYNFPDKRYSFPQAVKLIETYVENLIFANNVDAVFIEDINLRFSALVFKRLAHLQGVLINLFEKTGILYDCVYPTMWQNYCKARSRTSKEVKADTTEAAKTGKHNSKALSLEFVKTQFGVDTRDDNLADAICIGWYVVNNIEIQKSDNLKEKSAK